MQFRTKLWLLGLAMVGLVVILYVFGKLPPSVVKFLGFMLFVGAVAFGIWLIYRGLTRKSSWN